MHQKVIQINLKCEAWELKFQLSIIPLGHIPMKHICRRLEQIQKLFTTYQTETPQLDWLPSLQQLYSNLNQIYLRMKLLITKIATLSIVFIFISHKINNHFYHTLGIMNRKKLVPSTRNWRIALKLRFETRWRIECGCWVLKIIGATLVVRRNGSCWR